MTFLRAFALRLHFASLVALLGAFAAGCGGLFPAPGTIKSDSHVHAFQTASFAYAFSLGHSAEWEARLQRMEKDGMPFLKALKESPYRMKVVVRPRNEANVDYEFYDVDLAFEPKAGGETLVLPGAEGTDRSVYMSHLAPIAKATKLDPDLVKRGHEAVYA